MSIKPFRNNTKIDLDKAKQDIKKYIIPTEMDSIPIPKQKYTNMNAPKEAAVLQEFDNPAMRVAYNFFNTFATPLKAAENVSALIGNLVYANDEDKRKEANEKSDRYFSKYKLPEPPKPDSGIDTAANLLGGLAGSVAYGGLLGAGTGTSKIAEAIGSKINNPLLSRVASGAVENAALGLPENVLYGVAQNDNIGDMAKDVATGTLFDAGAGALLGGALKGLETRQLNKSTKAADKVAKANEIQNTMQNAIKSSDELTNSALKNIDNTIDTMPPASSVDVVSNPSYMSLATDIPSVSTPVKGAVQAVDGTVTPNTFDDVINSIGEREAFNNYYKSTSDFVPTGTINMNGKDYNANELVEAFDKALPETVEEIEPLIQNLETVAAGRRGGFDFGIGRNLDPRNKMFRQLDEIADAQLFAAKRKLEWLKLPEGENGTKVRGFIEQRLKGQDEISSPEFIEALSGKSEKYIPKSDIELGKQADELINTDVKENEFYNFMMKNPNQNLNDVQIATAKKMIDKYIQSGDMEKSIDLTRSLSRSGTEAGRSLRQYAIKKITDPLSVLQFADKQFKQAADSVIGEGGSNQLNDFIKRINDMISDNWDDLDSKKLEEIIKKVIDETPSSETKLKNILRNKLGDKKSLAERIMQAVEGDALNDNDLKKVFMQELNLPLLDTETAQNLIELVKLAGTKVEGSTEQAEIFMQIYRTLGEMMPVSFGDKFAAWRKLSMLANPKTHLKNFVSNIFMMPMRKLNDLVSTGLEKLLPEADRTRSLGWRATQEGNALVNSANFKQSTDKALAEMMNFGKYDLSDSTVLRNRKFFKTEALNKASDFNSKWLELEDQFAFKRAFEDNLGQFITARNLTDITDNAYSFAFNRALEATFRADNAVNDAIQRIKKAIPNKYYQQFADVVIPFTKTPANLFQQAFQYSPIGLAKNGAELYKVLNGKSGKQAAQAIYDFSKGLNGTALMALGLYMGASGLINTKYGKSEKQRSADELLGNQQYSIKIGDTSISFDWLQPLAFPLIIGASIGQETASQDLNDEDNKSLLDAGFSVWGSIASGMDSLFELSMLQSLFDLLGGKPSEALDKLVSNTSSQAIPTVVGQFARSIDPVQRVAKADNGFQTIINRNAAKLPFASYLLQPKLDSFGNTITRGNESNPAINLLNQFINPATTRKPIKADDQYTRALLDLYKSTGDTKVLPTFVNAQDEGLTPSEYTDTAKQVGNKQYIALQEIIDNPNQMYRIGQKITLPNGEEKTKYINKRWADMTDNEKAKILSRNFGNTKDEFLGEAQGGG